MTERKPSVGRIAWAVVAVVGKRLSASATTAIIRLRWVFYIAGAGGALLGVIRFFEWALAHGAKGGDFLSFSGGALGAGLAVAGARWLSFSTERRQAKQDASAFTLTLWFAIKTWEIILRRDVTDPPAGVYNSALLTQSCEWAAKLLHMIDGDIAKRESNNPAKAGSLFSLGMTIRRHSEFINGINNTPAFALSSKEQLSEKLDKLWFVIFDIIRPAYSALDKYSKGSWKSETITALNDRFEAMALKLLHSKGEAEGITSIYEGGKGMTEDEHWEYVSQFFEEFKK